MYFGDIYILDFGSFKLMREFTKLFQGQHMEIPPEESTDLEELEQFAKMFKQKRIKLGKLYLNF